MEANKFMINNALESNGRKESWLTANPVDRCQNYMQPTTGG